MAYIGVSPSNGVRRVYDYTATAGQTSFSGSDNNSQTLAYTDSAYIDVYQNGILLIPSDYTATTGTTVVLDTGATVNDTVQIVAYDVFSVADTVSASDGGSFGGNVGVGGTLSVTGNVISPITIGGTTPTLTIGDAGAEDTKIVFDGNAQDFHIGLDDSADSLTIGLGSTLGTTSHMVFDANGIITKPLQPVFHATKDGTDESNLGINSNHKMAWASERFDVNLDFDLTNNQFVAPVTGKYFLSCTARFEQVDVDATYYLWTLVTSNQTFHTIIDPNYSADNVYHSMSINIVTDMDASDTAYMQFHQAGGTNQTDVDGDPQFTFFTGFLIA